MTVSKREFFDMAHWKEKRYATLIYQAGKNPADFEVVEAQDIINFELQQAINSIASPGCIADSFKVEALAVPADNKVRIYQGRAYAQSLLDGAEYSGIRLDLPDVLTTFPSLTYEHAVDINGYYEKTFTEQTLVPGAGAYRYDLIYVEFWRKEYTPAVDSEMQDPVLSETARREKWYYEIHFLQGDQPGTIKNPTIPTLTAGHYGMRLAIIKRINTELVSPESIIDVRPKFSSGNNLVGTNLVTVGAVGGNYETLYDVIASRVDANAITPTVDNPYTVVMQPGIYSCPFQFNTGTLGYVKIIGSGIDKTILEFEDLYSLGFSEWISIGASPTIEFSDMTIRFADGYADSANLININGGTVKLNNCRIGQVGTGMDYGAINVIDGVLTLQNCEIEARSATIGCIHMSGTSEVSIYDSVIKQSGYMTVENESLTTGLLRIWNSGIIGNKHVLYLNGYSEVRSCLVSKEAWFVGDALSGGNTVSILASSKLFSCRILGTLGSNPIEVGTDAEFHDCTHDDVVTIASAGTAKFFTCSLSNVLVSNTASPEFYNCEFVDSSSVSLSLITVSSAKIMDSVFKRDGACVLGDGATFDMIGCHMATTGAFNLVEIGGVCAPNIQGCQFHLDHASAVGIKMTANTATPVVTNCTFLGNSSALMFDATTATTMKAAFISGDTTLKGTNVTITNIQKTL